MEYGFYKYKLPKGYSFPLKRSVLDEYLEAAKIEKVSQIYFSFHRNTDNIILRSDFFGEAHKGSAGAGFSSITLSAVTSDKRKEIEIVLIEKVLPALCEWLIFSEKAGNAWRGKSRHLVFRYSDGNLIKSEY